MEHVVNLVQVYMRHEMSLYDFQRRPQWRSGAHSPIESITVPPPASSTSRAARVPTSGMGLNCGRQSSSQPSTPHLLRHLTSTIRSVRLGCDDLYLNIDTGVGVLYVVFRPCLTRISPEVQLWAGSGASMPQVPVWNNVQTSRPHPRASRRKSRQPLHARKVEEGMGGSHSVY